MRLPQLVRRTDSGERYVPGRTVRWAVVATTVLTFVAALLVTLFWR